MTKNFLGMEIEGDIVHGYHQVPQRPREEFEPLLQQVLEQEGVLGLAWTQYTPYFNDGEQCVFGVGEVSIAMQDAGKPKDFDYDWQEEDAESGLFWLTTYDDEFKQIIGDASLKVIVNEHGEHKWVPVISDPSVAPNPVLFSAFNELTKAIGSGSFHNVLLELFGDHALVRIDNRNRKVIVDEYIHD